MSEILIHDDARDTPPPVGNLKLCFQSGYLRGLNSAGKLFRLQTEAGTPVNGVAATGVLTMDTQPTANDTVTIGPTTYTWVASGATAGQINRGADLAAAKVNLVAAINGSDSINTAHTLVTAAAFSSDNMTITAIRAGAAANSIATTETFTAGTNVWAAALMSGGVDATKGSAGDRMYDSSYMYLAIADVAVTSTSGWRRTAHSSF